MRFTRMPFTRCVYDNADTSNPKLVYAARTGNEADELVHSLNDCPWQVVGFYEEFIDISVEPYKTLGTRRVETLDRKLGAPGRVERTLREPLTLTKGMKQVTVNASQSRPLRVATMLQILCGKSK